MKFDTENLIQERVVGYNNQRYRKVKKNASPMNPTQTKGF